MKKLFAVFMVIGFMAMAGSAPAAGGTSVTVSATVTGTCEFASTGSVAFTLNPSTGGEVKGTVTQPLFWCTRDTGYTISDDNGMNRDGTTYRMKGPGDQYIPYSFTYTASGSGLGKGTNITMDIASSVVEAAYINAAAGNYEDTVTLSITP